MRDSFIAARQTITNTACQLFLSKGYAAVSMEDISKELRVETDYLKLHFSNKESILDAATETIYHDVSLILKGFVKHEFSSLVAEEKVKISKERLRFISPLAAENFSARMVDHLDAIFDYFICHRVPLCVMLIEAMRPSKYESCVDRLFSLFLPGRKNPVFEGEWELAALLTKTTMNYRMFFQTNVQPLLFYAAFEADKMKHSDSANDDNRALVISVIRKHNMQFVQGKDIIFPNC